MRAASTNEPAATPLTVDDLNAALAAVRVEGPDPIARTLRYSLPDLNDATLTVEFYIGEDTHNCQRRSSPLSAERTG